MSNELLDEPEPDRNEYGGPARESATELRLIITFTEPVYTEPLTDGLGEWMRELEAEKDGFAKLGIADWRFETVTT